MFRFRQIKPEYLHLYEDNINYGQLVSKDIIDRSDLIYEAETQATDSEEKLKVYKYFDSSLIEVRKYLFP